MGGGKQRAPLFFFEVLRRERRKTPSILFTFFQTRKGEKNSFKSLLKIIDALVSRSLSPSPQASLAMPAKTSEWTTVTKPSSRRTKKETEAAAATTATATTLPLPASPATPDASTTLKNLLGVAAPEKQQQQQQPQKEELVVAEAVARVSTPPTAEEKKAEVKAKQKKAPSPLKAKAPTTKKTPAPAEAAAGPSSSSAPSSSAAPSVRAAPSSLRVAQVRLEWE